MGAFDGGEGEGEPADFLEVGGAELGVFLVEVFDGGGLAVEELDGAHAGEAFLEVGVLGGLSVANVAVGVSEVAVDVDEEAVE